MLIRELAKARESSRHVVTEGWESTRLLLKDDAAGFSFHITTMYAGRELYMHYQNHLEAVYVLQGEGTIEDIANGAIHELQPGTLYVLDNHDRHIVRPRTDIITACVFNPPVTGREVHDENGAYPADAAAADAASSTIR